MVTCLIFHVTLIYLLADMCVMVKYVYFLCYFDIWLLVDDSDIF